MDELKKLLAEILRIETEVTALREGLEQLLKTEVVTRGDSYNKDETEKPVNPWDKSELKLRRRD